VIAPIDPQAFGDKRATIGDQAEALRCGGLPPRERNFIPMAYHGDFNRARSMFGAVARCPIDDVLLGVGGSSLGALERPAVKEVRKRERACGVRSAHASMLLPLSRSYRRVKGNAGTEKATPPIRGEKSLTRLKAGGYQVNETTRSTRQKSQ
jgi:hypothetical protein